MDDCGLGRFGFLISAASMLPATDELADVYALRINLPPLEELHRPSNRRPTLCIRPARTHRGQLRDWFVRAQLIIRHRAHRADLHTTTTATSASERCNAIGALRVWSTDRSGIAGELFPHAHQYSGLARWARRSPESKSAKVPTRARRPDRLNRQRPRDGRALNASNRE